ncbi:MAG: hypothetical protein ACLGG5_04040 [Thermoleophilia bacterium]
MLPATLRWAGLALLGIVIAAAVSVAASRLASQQIGLASEPISAGDALAPARRGPRPAPAESRGSSSSPSKGKGSAAHRASPPPASTQPATPVAPAPSPPTEEFEPGHTGGDGEPGGGGADD